MWRLGRCLVLAATLLAAAVAPSAAHGAGPAVLVLADDSVSSGVRRRIEQVVASRRSLSRSRRLPAPRAAELRELAITERANAVALALERARRHESEAAWDACAREAASAMGDAIEALAQANRLPLLRELHLQIGVCMTLAGLTANARPHFVAAALLDEAPPQPGRFREEAEQALAQAGEQVRARSRGLVRIDTEPAGAEVWIDGRKAAGVTPLDVAVRLGDHFVTLRRFRFEPESQRRVLQPGSRLRVELLEARRSTLRAQLAEVTARRRNVSRRELLLARAAWSGAGMLLWISPARPARARGTPSDGPLRPLAEPADGAEQPLFLALYDVASGRLVRRRSLLEPGDDDGLRSLVCAVLGDACEPVDEGIPWYVWPIAGVALAGAAVAAGFIIDAARPVKFCPAGGCD